MIKEIDGSQHYTEQGLQKDEYRTEKLKDFGLIVIRLTNWQVNNKFADVCDYIDLIAKASLLEGANMNGGFYEKYMLK